MTIVKHTRIWAVQIMNDRDGKSSLLSFTKLDRRQLKPFGDVPELVLFAAQFRLITHTVGGKAQRASVTTRGE